MKTNLPKPIIINRIINENYKVKTFVSKTEIKSKPGQFILVWLPRLAERPFAVVDDSPLAFTVAKVGKFTQALHNLKEGDRIWFRGPFGKGVFKLEGEEHLLIGGGYGVAPLYFLAKKSLKGHKMTMIIGAKSKNELLFEEKFNRLRIKVQVATEDGSRGENGLAPNLLYKILSEKKVDCVYACGPMPMLAKVVEICHNFKVNFQISLETIIKCGIGVCGSCSYQGKLVCQDGPVFRHWPF